MFSDVRGAAGQGWLASVATVLEKPANQDVVVELLRAIAAYAAHLPLDRTPVQDMDTIAARADDLLEGAAPGELVQALPALRPQVRAMLMLSLVDEPLANPVFSRTDAIGTVMRKKLRPVTGPIREQIDILSAH